LNRVPHPWTLLGSDIVYPSPDSSLLELKVLIPLWTWTPFQFGLVSSIFFLISPGQLTRVTFTLLAYPFVLPESRPNSLSELHPSALPEPYPITSILTRHYTFIPDQIILPDYSPDQTSTYPVLPGRITLPDLFLIGLLPTRSYPATFPDLITQSGNASLPQLLTRPYPITLPGQVPSTGLTRKLPYRPPTLTWLILADNASR
jgi:hypothetical protein